MIGVDTNVLVRFLVADSAQQHAEVLAMLRRAQARDQAIFIGDIVLAETCWVLSASYALSRERLAAALRALLSADGLEFESDQRCMAALARFEKGTAGYADYLIAERARDAGCSVLATFDKKLRIEGGCASPRDVLAAE